MLQQELLERSGNKCELCESSAPISLYEVQPQTDSTEDNCFMICDKCLAQVTQTEALDSKHLSCLRTSIWSAVPGVQVITWRLLNRLKSEGWTADSLDAMYLDEETLAWAQAGLENEDNQTEDIHKDCNGAALQ